MTTHANSTEAGACAADAHAFVRAPSPCIDENEDWIRMRVALEQVDGKVEKPESPTDASDLDFMFSQYTESLPSALTLGNVDFDQLDAIIVTNMSAPAVPAASDAKAPSAEPPAATAEPPAALEPPRAVPAASDAEATAAKPDGAVPTAAKQNDTKSGTGSRTSGDAEPTTHCEAPASTSESQSAEAPKFEYEPNDTSRIAKYWASTCDRFLAKLEKDFVERYNLKHLRENPPLPYTIKNVQPKVLVFMYRHNGEEIYCHEHNATGSRHNTKMLGHLDWPIHLDGTPIYMSKAIEWCREAAALAAETGAVPSKPKRKSVATSTASPTAPKRQRTSNAKQPSPELPSRVAQDHKRKRDEAASGGAAALVAATGAKKLPKELRGIQPTANYAAANANRPFFGGLAKKRRSQVTDRLAF